MSPAAPGAGSHGHKNENDRQYHKTSDNKLRLQVHLVGIL